MPKQRQQNDIIKCSSQNKKKVTTGTSFPPKLLVDDKITKRSLDVLAIVPSAVFVSRNFMDLHECTAWIKCAEAMGFESLRSPRSREYAHRECGRISRNDWCMANRLYERMKPVVEEIAGQVLISNSNSTYAPLTCNGNIRLYRYCKHMSFGRHFDGSEKISKFEGAYTEITVLIYLSSCDGGATRFYLPTSSKTTSSRKKKSKKSNNEGIAFVPEAGAVLFHIHGDRCLEHEADPVLDGVKYVLRTDIVYAPTQP